MSLEPTTNFRDSNGVDLGKKLVTKEYLLEVYGSILDSIGISGLTVTPALWVWGANGINDGQLGTNDLVVKSTPVTTFAGGIDWEQVAGGFLHTAAIKTDGTLWVWGRNQESQLGDNTTTKRITPVTTFIGGTNWKQVSGGNYHTAAIKTDGTLWVWGYNDKGQVGDNSTVSRNTPVTTFSGGTNWKFVSCGGSHTLAIKTDGTLWSWGGNSYGQLGNNQSGASAHRSTPVTTILGGTNWKFVAGGYYCTLAVKTDGTLWTWGKNGSGQLGDNTIVNRITPVTTFAGGNNWKSVSGSGYSHSAAIKTDGTLWVWGNNGNGQLGDNTTVDRLTPVTTFSGGTNWKQVTCSQNSSAVIKTDGSLWVWGDNNQAQLGINNGLDRNTPVTTVLGGNDWKQISSRGDHMVAIESVDYI